MGSIKKRKKKNKEGFVGVRLNDSESKLLQNYCDSTGKSRSDAVREGLLKLVFGGENDE